MTVENMTTGEMVGAFFVAFVAIGTLLMKAQGIFEWLKSLFNSGQAAEMEAIAKAQIEPVNEQCDTIIRGMEKLTETVEGGLTQVYQRLEAHEEVMTAKIEGVDKRIEGTQKWLSNVETMAKENAKGVSKVEGKVEMLAK